MEDSQDKNSQPGTIWFTALVFVFLSLFFHSNHCNSSPAGTLIDLTKSGGEGFQHKGKIVIDASLRSLNAIGNGVQIGEDIPSIAYDRDKGVLVGNFGGILWQNRPDQEKLSSSGHISFTLEGRFFDTNPSTGINYETNQHLITAIGSNEEIWQLRHSAGQQLIFVQNPMIDTQYIRTGGGTRGVWGGIRTHRVDISWSGDQLKVFVDYYLVWEGFRHLQMDFQEIYAGSRGATWENSLSETWIRDFKVSTTPITLSENPDIERISMYGDSFISNGQYPKVGGGSNYYFAIGGTTPDNSIEPCYDSGAQFGDYGLIPSIHRQLNSFGIYPSGNRISNWSEKGTGVTTWGCNLLSSRMNTSVSGGYAIPDVAFFVIGTNDVANGESNWDSWKNAYLTELDKLITLNTDIIIIIANVAPMTPDNSFDTPFFREGVDSANLKIAELASERAQITIVDIFNNLGGHDNWDPDDFNGINDRHPSANGYQKYTYLFVEELLARYDPNIEITATTNGGGGGCSLIYTKTSIDPIWLFFLLAFIVKICIFPRKIRKTIQRHP